MQLADARRSVAASPSRRIRQLGSCGARLDVPTIAQLRQLEPAGRDGVPANRPGDHGQGAGVSRAADDGGQFWPPAVTFISRGPMPRRPRVFTVPEQTRQIEPADAWHYWTIGAQGHARKPRPAMDVEQSARARIGTECRWVCAIGAVWRWRPADLLVSPGYFDSAPRQNGAVTPNPNCPPRERGFTNSSMLEPRRMKAAYIKRPGRRTTIVYGELPRPSPARARCWSRSSRGRQPDRHLHSPGAVAMPLAFPFIVGCDLAGRWSRVAEGRCV